MTTDIVPAHDRVVLALAAVNQAHLIAVAQPNATRQLLAVAEAHAALTSAFPGEDLSSAVLPPSEDDGHRCSYWLEIALGELDDAANRTPAYLLGRPTDLVRRALHVSLFSRPCDA